jgi:hypothetical protein
LGAFIELFMMCALQCPFIIIIISFAVLSGFFKNRLSSSHLLTCFAISNQTTHPISHLALLGTTFSLQGSSFRIRYNVRADKERGVSAKVECACRVCALSVTDNSVW